MASVPRTGHESLIWSRNAQCSCVGRRICGADPVRPVLRKVGFELEPTLSRRVAGLKESREGPPPGKRLGRLAGKAPGLGRADVRGENELRELAGQPRDVERAAGGERAAEEGCKGA